MEDENITDLDELASIFFGSNLKLLLGGHKRQEFLGNSEMTVQKRFLAE